MKREHEARTLPPAQCLLDVRAALGEGILWHPLEQALYFVDIPNSLLYRHRADARIENWSVAPNLSAVVPCTAGGLLGTLRDGLYHITLEPLVVSRIEAVEAEQPGNRFNDGYSDQHGQFWFGSMDDDQRQSSGVFYRRDSLGQVHPHPELGRFCITNGPAFSAAGDCMYFTDTVQQRIYKTRLSASGVPGAAQLHIDFRSQPGFPDGMCTDSAGGLWVCHFGGGRVTRFDAAGIADVVVPIPAPNVTKCTFGGAALDHLYISTASVEMDAATQRAHPQAGGVFVAPTDFTGIPVVAVSR